jgi:hypothetical protein
MACEKDKPEIYPVARSIERADPKRRIAVQRCILRLA